MPGQWVVIMSMCTCNDIYFLTLTEQCCYGKTVFYRTDEEVELLLRATLEYKTSGGWMEIISLTAQTV